MRRAFLFGLLALGLASCATAPSTRSFTGVWTWHFETSSFTTSTGEGPYWLVASGSVWEELNAPIRASGQGPYGRVAIVIEGTLSEQGRFGHLGNYRHEIRVNRVLDARLLSASSPPQGS